MKLLLVLTAASFALAGCSGGSEPVSKKDEDSLRNNFTRALTPEEQARMNGAPAKGAPPGGGPP